MRHLATLLQLPQSLLIFIVAWSPNAGAELQWPYNLPAHVRYYPEDEAHVKRELGIQKRLAVESPVAVRKMSVDEGEKFFLEYWQFDSGPADPLGIRSDSWGQPQEERDFTNSSIPIEAGAPFRVHDFSSNDQAFLRFAIRDVLLGKRGFQCPTGTTACTSINRPNSCCSTSSTCIIITDTGLGDVGCCPNGVTCAGSVSSCPAGYSSCPNSPNGGCCIPNFSCEDVGCVSQSTQVVTVQPSTSSSTPTPTPSTSTVSSSSLPCSSGFQSCPASLGGGCCPTDRSCAPGILCASTTSTGSASAPARPTGDASSGQLTTSAPSSTITDTVSVCPTGFYMCSAFYRGGCCRVGRDCDSTSCPTTASTTVVAGDGVTIVAPAGASLASGAALSCATGWYSCAASLGGDCCPNGYACGTSVCSATVSGGGTAGKEAPNSKAVHGERVGWLVLALATTVSGLAMVLL